MDFGAILQAAAARQSSAASNRDNFYKTKFEPPKKESKSKTLSNNIQKFLAKKEEEERRKNVETRKKRDELLAMRDPKATNKIKKMLKVIKSANKSVLEDAIDNVNTAVTVNGPEQPDEDDYGYVSQEASAFYSKMMEKYKKVPDDDKFSSSKKIINSDLTGTKDRVRAAIMRQQEEESAPHKRRKKSNYHDEENNFIDDSDIYSKPQEKPDPKPKPKRPPPPPMDFNQLLKIAEKKQFEPVVLEPKKVEVINEPERLMTKKQKREFEELKAFKEARSQRERAMAASGKKDVPSNSSNQKSNNLQRSDSSGKPQNISNMRIPKIGDKSSSSTHNIKMNSSNPSSAKGQILKKEDSLNRKPLKPDDSRSESSMRPSKSSEKLSEKPKAITSDKISKSSTINKFSKTSSSSPDINKNNMLNRTNNNINKSSPSGSQSNGHRFGTSSTSNTKPVKNISSSSKISSNSKIQSSSGNNQISKDDRRLISDKNVNKNNASSAPVKKINIQDKKPGNYSGRTESNGQMPRNINDIKKNKQSPALVKGSRPSPSTDVKATRQFPPADVKGTRQFPPSDVKGTRQFPPADVKGTRQFPPTDVRKIRQPPVKSNKDKFSNKRRILDDDDSEYDSSLDDFIDDGPEEGNDVSSYIKEIFGYDKSKYRDMDDDDRNMESNYSQVMREEYISKKIGIMEDLEDMKMEALEKKKKAMKKRRID